MDSSEGPTTAAAPSIDAETLHLEGSFGHFVVLGKLGSGGMGVVYLAHDPTIDRKVALKLIRADTCATSNRRTRLIREAQALGKVSHANVVTVYEAGVVGEQVFVAMEYVEGQTLHGWLAERPRAWREVVAMFVRVGRGLAAVHAAGLVHRDFKPDNVLVGKDGRVRVTDFGLVGAAGATSDDPPGASPATELYAPLTQTGVNVGTPRYMAPEQHEGRAVDARADQFAFALSLHEALARERPFAGATPAEILARINAEDRRPLPRGIPRRIVKLLRRALRPEPRLRYPSMTALLADLDKSPLVTPRRALAGAVLAGLSGVAVWGALSAARRDQRCRGAEQKLAGAWDGAVRRSLEGAFAASGQPRASAAFTRLAARLDDYAGAWVAMRTAACEATVRGEQSGAMLDARMACLDRRRDELAQLTLVLGQEPNAVDRAANAAAQLDSIVECADVAALTAASPPPPPAQRLAAEALRQKLARALAYQRVGNTKAATDTVTPLVAEAQALGYAPLLAEALQLRGLLQADADPKAAEATLREAVAAAADGKADAVAVAAQLSLLYVVGVKQSRRGEALAMEPMIDAAVRRTGNPAALRAQLQQSIGHILYLDGKYAEALASLDASLRAREQRFGADSVEVASTLGTLVVVLQKVDRWDDAHRHAERALAIVERAFGPESMDFAKLVNELGNIALQRNDIDAARRYYERTRAIIEHHYGPTSFNVAVVLQNLASIDMDQGRLDEARAQNDRAISILEKVLGPDHPNVARALGIRGAILRKQERFAEARAVVERALAIREKRLGPDHADVAITLANLAEIHRDLHQPREAVPLLERALAIRERAYPNGHPRVLRTILVLGNVYLEAGRRVDALRAAERAAKLHDDKTEPEDTADTDWLLARALRENGREAARAREMAAHARAYWVGAGKQEQVDRVDRWLATRRTP